MNLFNLNQHIKSNPNKGTWFRRSVVLTSLFEILSTRLITQFTHTLLCQNKILTLHVCLQRARARVCACLWTYAPSFCALLFACWWKPLYLSVSACVRVGDNLRFVCKYRYVRISLNMFVCLCMLCRIFAFIIVFVCVSIMYTCVLFMHIFALIYKITSMWELVRFAVRVYTTHFPRVRIRVTACARDGHKRYLIYSYYLHCARVCERNISNAWCKHLEKYLQH